MTNEATSILPDLALRLATIERAICDAVGNIAKCPSASKIQAEAIQWIYSDDTHPFSFLDCAQAINANVIRIRRNVRASIRNKSSFSPSNRSKIRALKFCCRLDDAGLLIQYVERPHGR